MSSTVLALVPTTGLPGVDVAGELVDELAYRPNLDTEALCLCALVWAPVATARVVVEHLRSSDFYRPAYGELYSVIAELVEAGQPHSAPLILAQLHSAGRVDGQLSRALLEITLADARGHELGHYARAVLAAAYRRGYTTAATQLAQIAEEGDEDELFELMCELGRERRHAKDRVAAAGAAFTTV